MEMKLAENIRAFRKERSLTQEQLAEVLGVTAGAVYKWEAKLSLPELEIIVSMADFFDTSVDVLLGYEIKDNRLEATVTRLQEYRCAKDRTGLAQAEMALKKYPHSFQIVNESAALYGCFGFESGDKALLRRSLELLERSLVLLPQNTDPEISEQTLYGKMAQVYLGLDEFEKGLALLKAHNAGGLYSHKIGHMLAQGDMIDDAVPFLSEAMANILTELIGVVIGYMNVFYKRGDHASGEAILSLGTELFGRLRRGNKPNYLDKVSSVMHVAIAYAQLMTGRTAEARSSLVKAAELAEFFDGAPSYEVSDIRFIGRIEGASAYDDIGVTAMDGVVNTVSQFDNEEFAALWKSVSGDV